MLMKKQKAHELLMDMDGLFTELVNWLKGQYDAASGGFYYARSSRLLHGRVPDIESTAQALNMLERLGLLIAMPERIKADMLHFFRSRQDEKTGCFYDADPAMREDEVMVARALGYSMNAIRKLGGEPAYALPKERESAPAYMQSEDSYSRWLRQMDLSNSWRGCDRLACSHVYLKQLDPLVREGYMHTAFRFFEETQDQGSGLWGEGSLYVRISGTFKLHTFYNAFQMPMPRMDRMYASILAVLRHEQASDMCYIRNPIHLLSYIKPQISDEEMCFILQTTAINLSRLLRMDGGFSRELARSPSAPNAAQIKEGTDYPDRPRPVYLSEGKAEGDMNAATQALLIRSLCHKLAGLEPPALKEKQLSTFYDSF